MNYIAIDPGANGGIAWGNQQFSLVEKMPDTPVDMLELLRDIKHGFDRDTCKVILEKVWVFPKQGIVSAATFMKHVGHIEMAMMALSLPVVEVLPAVWMKTLGLGTSSECATKTAWKTKLKLKAQTTFPGMKINKKTCDALLLLDYARKSNV